MKMYDAMYDSENPDMDDPELGYHTGRGRHAPASAPDLAQDDSEDDAAAAPDIHAAVNEARAYVNTYRRKRDRAWLRDEDDAILYQGDAWAFIDHAVGDLSEALLAFEKPHDGILSTPQLRAMDRRQIAGQLRYILSYLACAESDILDINSRMETLESLYRDGRMSAWRYKCAMDNLQAKLAAISDNYDIISQRPYDHAAVAQLDNYPGMIDDEIARHGSSSIMDILNRLRCTDRDRALDLVQSYVDNGEISDDQAQELVRMLDKKDYEW